MGYYGRDPLRLMITGEITSLRPAFPASGQPTLDHQRARTCCTASAASRSRTPTSNMTDSEIAQRDRRGDSDVDRPHRPGGRGAEERIRRTCSRTTSYDIVFLLERARRIGYDLFVEEEPTGRAGCLYFGPSSASRRATYQLDVRRAR